MYMIRAEQRFKSTGDGSMENPHVPEGDVNILNANLDVAVINGVLDVSVQDPTTDTLILPLAQVLIDDITVTVEAVREDTEINVSSIVGVNLGDHIRIFDTSGGSNRYYNGTVLSLATGIIGLDSPIDFEYPVGGQVTISNINMAVDGSVTPVHFHLRTGTPSIPNSIDITRMIMVCTCDGAVDLNKFGDITDGLDKGIVFRVMNDTEGSLRNVYNVKTNADLALLAFDWSPYVASNPSQGINGFAWRLTFGSQGKIGVVIRVDQFGQLGMIVQDDLSDLISLFCIVEGHVTDEVT